MWGDRKAWRMAEQEEAYNRAVAIKGHLAVGLLGRPKARGQDLV